MVREKADPQLAELEMIRKLIVIALLQSGVTQAQMGGILGISQSQISRMFPPGALAALSGKPKKGLAKRAAVESHDNA